MKKKPFFSEPYYYLLSIKWFEEWKTYAGYEKIIANQKPNEEVNKS